MKMNEMFLGYASPVVEVIKVQVEKGFQASVDPDNSVTPPGAFD